MAGIVAYEGLHAGSARLDITPRAGTQVGGSIGMNRPARLLLEPLFAKALVLGNGDRRLCVVSLDVPTVDTAWATKIRRLAADRFGFDVEAVMVHATQTQAAPHIGRVWSRSKRIPRELEWLHSPPEEYSLTAVERILEAIGQALESMEPVRVGVGSGLEGRVAFNRRVIMRDGSARTLGLQAADPNILYVEGPIDPELGVLTLSTDRLRMVSMLLHHTCHPCHGNTDLYVITSGWPGAWCDQMSRVHGPECVPLVINGCCGNIHHRNRLDPDFHHSDDYHRLGRLLAETTLDVLKHRMIYLDEPELDFRSKHIMIPLREVNPQAIAEAQKLLDEHPEPLWMNEEQSAVDWSWMYAVAILDMAESRERDKEFDYEVQVFRIGNTALVGLGGEPFVEGQLEIKLRSPAYRTFVAHMTSSSPGYIPTRRALERGGYETRLGSAKLEPGALDRIVAGTSDLLQEMFRDA